MSLEQYKSKIVNLTSAARLNGASTNFNLSIPPNSREFNNVVGIQMVSASIPNTFYNITQQNNFFQYRFGPLNTIGTVLVAEGQYELTDLLTEISSQMTTDSSSNVSWTLNSVDYKVLFESDNESFAFYTDDETLVPLLISLGFPKSLVPYGPGNSISATHIVNVSGPSTVFIVSRSLTGATSDYSELTNIIRCIPLDVNFGSIVHYKIGDSESAVIKFTNARSLTNIDLKLVNRNNQVLSLGGLDWDLLIKVYYL